MSWMLMQQLLQQAHAFFSHNYHNMCPDYVTSHAVLQPLTATHTLFPVRHSSEPTGGSLCVQGLPVKAVDALHMSPGDCSAAADGELAQERQVECAASQPAERAHWPFYGHWESVELTDQFCCFGAQLVITEVQAAARSHKPIPSNVTPQ